MMRKLLEAFKDSLEELLRRIDLEFFKGADKGEFLAATLARHRLSPLMAIVLAGLCLFDVGAAIFALRAFFAPVAAEPASKPEWRLPAPAASAANAVAPAVGAGEQTLSRPIFAKSRRPPEPTEEAQPQKLEQVAPSAAGLTLSAVVKLGGAPRALIVSSSAPEGKWLLEGEEIDGWTVAEVHDFDVILQNGENEVQLKLFSEQAPEENEEGEQSTGF